MADILIDNQTAPSTPAAGKSVIWVDSTTKLLVQTNDAGRHTGDYSRNDAIAAQGAGFATDTYITNSGIQIPSFGMKVGQCYKWLISCSKTAAGSTASVLTVRIGSNQSTGDTSRLAMTQGIAQAATATKGLMWVIVSVQIVSASGVIGGGWGFSHTNFGDGGSALSSTFDNTALAGQYVGLSFNGNTSAAYTLNAVVAELVG